MKLFGSERQVIIYSWRWRLEEYITYHKWKRWHWEKINKDWLAWGPFLSWMSLGVIMTYPKDGKALSEVYSFLFPWIHKLLSLFSCWTETLITNFMKVDVENLKIYIFNYKNLVYLHWSNNIKVVNSIVSLFPSILTMDRNMIENYI